MAKLTESIFAVGALALAGIIGWELWDKTATAPPSLAVPAGTAEQASRPAQSESDTAYLEQILARPLFTPTRRPAPRDDARAKAMSVQLQSRLAGIVLGRQGREALFVEDGKPIVKNGKPKTSSLHEGDELEGWTIEKIELGQVIMRAGAVSLTVEPAWAKHSVGAPPTPVAPNIGAGQGIGAPIAILPRGQAAPAAPAANVEQAGGVPGNANQ